jgi:Uma2 family endonuclease
MVTQLRQIDQTRLYTLTEFEKMDFPDDGNIYELIEGEIVVTPPPGFQHGRISDRIAKEIHLFDVHDKLGQVLPPVWFKLAPGFGPAPDLAFIVAGRVPAESEGALEIVPDLVVEVWSPHDVETQKRRDEARNKIRNYQLVGVRLIWAINPPAKTFEVYHPDQITPIATLTIGDTLDGEVVLPGFQLAVTKLFE